MTGIASSMQPLDSLVGAAAQEGKDMSGRVG